MLSPFCSWGYLNSEAKRTGPAFRSQVQRTRCSLPDFDCFQQGIWSKDVGGW